MPEKHAWLYLLSSALLGKNVGVSPAASVGGTLCLTAYRVTSAPQLFLFIHLCQYVFGVQGSYGMNVHGTLTLCQRLLRTGRFL